MRRCVTFGDVAGVVTAPDRKAGRGRKISFSPIKKTTLELKLPLHQPLYVNSPESIETIRCMKPDLFVLFAYGQILSADLLSVPRWSINVHPSLLPRYRGAAPLQRSIMDGAEETGITIIQMAEKVDAGGIILQESIPIEPDDTYGKLADHVSRAAPFLVERAVQGLEDGSLVPQPQSMEGITAAPKIKKEERIINWSQPVARIYNQIRALSPEPLACTTFRGKRLEIIKARISDEDGLGKPGTLVMESGHLIVQCKSGFLELVEVKPEGKNQMPAEAFANGYRPKADEILGS